MKRLRNIFMLLKASNLTPSLNQPQKIIVFLIYVKKAELKTLEDRLTEYKEKKRKKKNLFPQITQQLHFRSSKINYVPKVFDKSMIFD
ncbi:CLUMA_CG019298, isoform A [Clunio marinus]|uniref:CLUMA_CG019298, isoform A n=1 Tax=Clunio marinus TaxID=568069 RepID=A0A1J1J349_9DIPT|nr:CLUMA_CG019298, isoform A [Clunio marinus]